VSVVRVGDAADVGHQTNMPWPQLLARNPKLNVLEVPADAMPDVNRRPAENVGFFDRQKLGGWEKIGFQFAERLIRYLPAAWQKGEFLLVRQNLLLRETALSLVSKGYSFRSLPETFPDPVAVDPAEQNHIRHLVDPLVRVFLEPLVVPQAIPTLVEIFAEKMTEAVSRYVASVDYWRATLAAQVGRNTQAVMTNILPDTYFAALHKACRDIGVPLLAFQHGVGREISSTGWTIQSTYEGNTADYFFSFNQEAAAVSSASPFNKAENIAAGLPAAYWRCNDYRTPARNSPPILFVSTKLYCGNVNYTVGARTNDYRMAEDEFHLAEQVLSRLPHRVLFKPYPNARYLDDDPVVENLKDFSNISVYPYRDDLSFLLPDCRVVVAARATSTIAWCAASGKPFVFINMPWDKPVRDSVRQAFDRAFFMFDAEAEDFAERLTDFLSQPLEIIEELWAEKAAARIDVVERYFGMANKGAGRRAANYIDSHIVGRKEVPTLSAGKELSRAAEDINADT